MAQKLQQQLKEVGSKLESPPASKDALVKLLKVRISLYICMRSEFQRKSALLFFICSLISACLGVMFLDACLKFM